MSSPSRTRLFYPIFIVLILAYLVGVQFFPLEGFLSFQASRSNEVLDDADLAQVEPLSEEYKISWGVIDHFAKPYRITQYYREIAKYISRNTGIKIHVVRAGDYRTLEQSFQQGKVQVANLSGFAYVRLVENEGPSIVPLVSELYNGLKYYVGYIVALKSSNINSIADLRGRRFAFVSKKSASGYLFPMAHLRSLGIEPEQHFGKITYAGNHQAVVNMIARKRVAAGATFDASFIYLGKEKDRFQVISKTPRIPSGVICASRKLPLQVRNLLLRELLQLTNSNEKWMVAFRKKSNITGWARVVPEDYRVVKEALSFKIQK